MAKEQVILEAAAKRPFLIIPWFSPDCFGNTDFVVEAREDFNSAHLD
jgi:hypothetical protein